MTEEHFYDEPRYYDIAFGWDLSREVAFFAETAFRHASRPVESVIELGCGTGSLLVALGTRGFAVAGLDRSRPMLDFARARVAKLGLPAELFLKDMADFSLYRRFDAAVSFRNTFSYLNLPERAASHLRHVANHLEAGGVYVIDLTLVPEGGELAGASEEWSAAQDQVRVDARWELSEDWDPAARTVTERLTLRGEERGWLRVWEQEAVLRLYSLPELVELAGRDGYFTLAAAYQGLNAGELVDDHAMAAGRVVVVLLRTGKPTPRPELTPGDADDGRRGGGRPYGTRRPRQGGDRSAKPAAPRTQRRAAKPQQAASAPAGAPAAGVPADEDGASAGPAKKRRPRRRRHGPRPAGGSEGTAPPQA